MDPEEFLAYIDSLPPSIQQSMMQYVMAGGDLNTGGTAPFGAGPMNTGRLGGQMQGPLGISPYDPMSAGAAYAYTPQLDTKGREQPFDLGTAQQNLNYVQDAQGNLFNNAMMMQGGEGVYAPGTFDPMPQAPGEYDMLVQSAMGYGPTTYQGFIAERVAKGVAPDVALSEFWAVANDPENPASAPLLASLPPKYVQQENPMDPTAAPRMVQVEGGDMQKPQEFVQQLATAQMKQVPQAPQYGAVAQDFINKGIPFPTERYGQGQYSTEALVPGYAEAQAAFPAAHERYLQARGATDPQKIQQAQARYLTGAREEAARPAPRRTSFGTEENRRASGGVVDGNLNIGGGMALDPTGGIVMGLGPNIPGVGYVGGTIQMSGGAPERSTEQQTAGVTRSAPPLPAMDPTTTGRSANRIVATTPGLSQGASNRQLENAKKSRRAAYREANSPEAAFYNNMNAGLNASGRTPTQDTLMARQLVNYMMGAYGPRG